MADTVSDMMPDISSNISSDSIDWCQASTPDFVNTFESLPSSAPRNHAHIIDLKS
jgi:hypothetical protein